MIKGIWHSAIVFQSIERIALLLGSNQRRCPIKVLRQRLNLIIHLSLTRDQASKLSSASKSTQAIPSKKMKSIILLAGVLCAVICVATCKAVVVPPPLSALSAPKFLEKISERGMAESQMETANALAQALQLATMESLSEKAKAQFLRSLARHAVNLWKD